MTTIFFFYVNVVSLCRVILYLLGSMNSRLGQFFYIPRVFLALTFLDVIDDTFSATIIASTSGGVVG